jgi:hypothetical protein
LDHLKYRFDERAGRIRAVVTSLAQVEDLGLENRGFQ